MKSLNRITVDTNPELCNLRCIMCEEHSDLSNFKENLYNETGITQRLMPKDWLSNVFIQAKELGVKEIIPTTMGEPLLYEHFETFLELCNKYKIQLNLTTNGTCPLKSAKEWAKQILPISNDIKFSVNGATKQIAESIMHGIDFNVQIENIWTFAKTRNLIFDKNGHYCTLSLQLTFLQNNMHEITDIIRLASELDIDRIKGHHVWTHYKELEELSFKKSEESINKWNDIIEIATDAVQKFKRKNGKKIVLENFHPLQLNENKFIPESYECPFLNKELWVSATGEISPCCAPDNLRKTLGNFGNIQKQNLYDILNSYEYSDLAINYRQKALCKTCIMRKPNKQ